MNDLRLEPIPLSPDAEQRIRSRIRAEARRGRETLVEATLHGGFAVAAAVWAVWAAVG